MAVEHWRCVQIDDDWDPSGCRDDAHSDMTQPVQLHNSGCISTLSVALIQLTNSQLNITELKGVPCCLKRLCCCLWRTGFIPINELGHCFASIKRNNAVVQHTSSSPLRAGGGASHNLRKIQMAVFAQRLVSRFPESRQYHVCSVHHASGLPGSPLTSSVPNGGLESSDTRQRLRACCCASGLAVADS
jgi:hypothetical protein